MFEVTYIEIRTKIVCKEVVYANTLVDAYNKVYKKDINNIVQVTNIVLKRNLERLSIQVLLEFQERNADAIKKFKKELLSMYFDAEIVKQYCRGIYKYEQMDVKYFIEYKHNKENE